MQNGGWFIKANPLNDRMPSMMKSSISLSPSSSSTSQTSSSSSSLSSLSSNDLAERKALQLKQQEANLLSLKMLNQLRKNQEVSRRSNRFSQSRLTDSIFDPNYEELSLDPLNSPRSQLRASKSLGHSDRMISTSFNDNHNHRHQQHHPFPHQYFRFDSRSQNPSEHHQSLILPDDVSDGRKAHGFGKDGDLSENSIAEDSIRRHSSNGSIISEPVATQQHLFSNNNNAEDDQISLEDQKQSVKKIIKSGWIQHTSTKNLLYYLQKIDEVLFKDAGYDYDTFDLMANNENFFGSNELDLLQNTNSNDNDGYDNGPRSMDKSKRGNIAQINKNLEIMLNRIMKTPSSVKKRGEGPQLSIDYPLTVLRQRLIAELARRKAKETEEQIAINTEILKKLGRRRRRRSVDSSKIAFHSSDSMIDCESYDCKLDDLNWKSNNLREKILNDFSGQNLRYKQNLRQNDDYKGVVDLNSGFDSIYEIIPIRADRIRYNDKDLLLDRFGDDDDYSMNRVSSIRTKSRPTNIDENYYYYLQNDRTNDIVRKKNRINSRKPSRIFRNRKQSESFHNNNNNDNNNRFRRTNPFEHLKMSITNEI